MNEPLSLGIRKGSGSSINKTENRLKILEELVSSSNHTSYRLPGQRDKFLSHVFYSTVDLLDSSNGTDVRHKVWRIYTKLIDGQAETIGQLRYYFFNILEQYDAKDEDIPLLIDFLIAYQSKSIAELMMIYEFLNVVLSYSHLPNEILSQSIVILCIGANRDELFPICMKIIRNLMGTYLGFATLTTLHHIIEDEINFGDKLLIRGAVHFLVQSIWGDLVQVTEKSGLSVTVVLPAFKMLLSNEMIVSPQISYEIADGIHCFVKNVHDNRLNKNRNDENQQHQNVDPNHKTMESTVIYCDEFQTLSSKSHDIVYHYTWDLILDICDIIVSNHLQSWKATIDKTNTEQNESLKVLRKILDILELFEKLLDSEQSDLIQQETDLSTPSFNNECLEKIFNIFEMARDFLSNETLIKMIDNRLNHIILNRFGFDLDAKLKRLRHIISVYFVSNRNNLVKLKCLEKLTNFLNDSNLIDIDIGNDSVILDPNDKEKSKMELVEVCMDMLASNAFTTSSPLPLKPSMIDKLLNKDKTRFWMIGHKIIQITTTGCTSRAIKNGLCNKCFMICHMNKPQNHQSSSSSTQPHNSLNSLSNQWSGGQYSNQSGSVDLQSQTENSSHDQFFQQQSMINSEADNNQTRRRHRSEIHHNTKLMKKMVNINDDYFMGKSKSNQIGSSIDSDLNGVSCNNSSKYCRCWCQTWAEILIRRATGNTRIMLRIENNLGDFPNNWTNTEGDDSLAEIFKNSNLQLNLGMKLQRSSDSIYTNDENLSETDSVTHETASKSSDSETVSIQNSNDKQSNSYKASQPVTRAASFGGSNRNNGHNLANDNNQNVNIYERAKNMISRKLEKDFSFEEKESISAESRGSQSSINDENNKIESDDSAAFSDQPNLMFRDRGHTISIPVQKSSSSNSVVRGQSSCEYSSISASNINLSSRQTISPVGLSPQFVFLQLYYNSMFKDEIGFGGSGGSNPIEKPILLDRNDSLVRSLGTFDRTTPYETHKIGILYVGPGQTKSRSEILSNQIGSYRYSKFLKEIGQLISLEEVNPKIFYVGGLSARDGPFAISWCDHLVQTIFHVATFMPTLQNDPNCNNKMAHIGNDLVCIVYNNSGEKFDLNNVKGGFGQVLQATVTITPLEYESNIVEIQCKKEFGEFIGHTDSQLLSDQALPLYVREIAVHANVSFLIDYTR
ncbi:tuberin-like protein [Sarcoptes scabiei]|uniref:Tuberin-like protein n=1 Tax=Sarcoptes scabiei TaxID=52283 RepID=A0A132ADS0_SARSC|nr:tuberin-like protein [Sarcoptes scabiei]